MVWPFTKLLWKIVAFVVFQIMMPIQFSRIVFPTTVRFAVDQIQIP